jgi:5-aminopentanamidase
MTLPFRVAGVQMDVAFGAKEQNLAAMARHVEAAAASKTDLVVFPECALAGYCFESPEEALPHAESIPGPSTTRMAEICQKHQCYVVFGMLETEGNRLFNAAVLVGPEGVVSGYRKIHLPYLGVDRFTQHGDRPFAVHAAGTARVGMNICYDGAFPESSRVMSLLGADLIVLPTNWPPGAECTASCITNARALENNIYYMSVNRVGEERGFRFIGGSRICDPSGRTLAVADHDREEVLFADLDLELARNKHLIRVPKKHEIWRFADRRPEMYGEIAVSRPETTGERRRPE